MIINNERQAKTLGEMEERARQRHLDDIRLQVKTREGRRLYWNLMVSCQPFVNVMTGNSNTFFNLGKQFVGHQMFLDLMEADPNAFALMWQEAAYEEQIDQQIIEQEEE